MTETFTCPRRVIGGLGYAPAAAVQGAPPRDVWKGEQCSYCGSLTPEAFLEYVHAGKILGVTSKSYKFYLDAFDRPVRGAAKFYTQHLTEVQGWEFDKFFRANRVRFDYSPPSLFIPGPSFARTRH